MYKKTCHCGAEFQTLIKHKKNCSKECGDRKQKKTKIEKAKNKINFRRKRNCIQCGKPYSWTPGKRFCSKRCNGLNFNDQKSVGSYLEIQIEKNDKKKWISKNADINLAIQKYLAVGGEIHRYQKQNDNFLDDALEDKDSSYLPGGKMQIERCEANGYGK